MGSRLAESSLEIDATGKVGVLSVLVAHEVHFGVGGVTLNLDETLLLLLLLLAQEVDQGLLLGRSNNDRLRGDQSAWGADEDVVVVDLGVWDVWSGAIGNSLGRGVVEEEVSGHYGPDAVAVGLADKSVAAGGGVGGAGGCAVRIVGVGQGHSGEKNDSLTGKKRREMIT